MTKTWNQQSETSISIQTHHALGWAFLDATEDYLLPGKALQSSMALLEGQGYVSGARYKGSSDSRFALNTGTKLEYSLGKQTKAGVREAS